MFGTRFAARSSAVLAVAVAALAGSSWIPASAVTVTGTRTTVSLSSANVHVYESVTATATVVGKAAAIATGTVDFTRGKQALCSDVPVDTATNSASCDLPAALAVSATAVKANYTPTAGTIFSPSSGSAALTVSKWTPVLAATATPGSGDCTHQHVLHFTVSAPADASAAVSNGLPVPSGTIDGPDTGYYTVALSKAGTAHTCQPIFGSRTTFSYSGDANFLPVDGSIAVKSADTAPHGGAPAPTPPHSKPGTAPHGGATPGSTPGGLAVTGPSASVAPTLELGFALVLSGIVLMAAGRRRWSRRTG